MKFAIALQGKRAERKLSFPVPSNDGTMKPLACVCVPLTSTEESEALEYAMAFSRRKGVEAPKVTDPLYDLGYMAKIVSIAVRDPDAGVPGERPPTFSDVEEVHSLTRETVTYLYTIVSAWCDECSPLRRTLSDSAIYAGMRALASEGDDGARFFDGLGPALQRNFMRILARQLLSFLEPKSPPGTPPASSDTKSPATSSPSRPPNTARSKSVRRVTPKATRKS
jgi:hypothetical protein